MSPLNHALDLQYAISVARNVNPTLDKTDAQLAEDPFVTWLAAVFNKRAEEAGGIRDEQIRALKESLEKLVHALSVQLGGADRLGALKAARTLLEKMKDNP